MTISKTKECDPCNELTKSFQLLYRLNLICNHSVLYRGVNITEVGVYEVWYL